MSAIPSAVNFSNAGITGQLQLAAKSVQSIVVPASSSKLALPLPVGLTTAGFVVLSSLNMQDLTVQLANTVGATELQVPPGTTVILYNATAIYVNSVQGGTLQLIIG